MLKRQTILSLIIAFLGIQLSATSCGKDSDDAPVIPAGDIKVELSAESLFVRPESGTEEINIKASADWAVKSSADWITIRPSGGLKDKETTVKISYQANTGMEERKADIEVVSGGHTIKKVGLTQGYVRKATVSTTSLVTGAQQSTVSVVVTANGAWTLTSDQTWASASPAKGEAGETKVEITTAVNNESEERIANLTLTCGDVTSNIKVTQLSDAVNVPAGYEMVWADEFNGGPNPGKDWVLENWPAGYVNNELQIYTSKKIDGKSTVEVKDGFLNITCFKASDGKIYSGRMNACPSKGWLYGYFEARILLPKGKGTWPAFWMMPVNVDWGKNPWPKCGEIDIMEEVGANPDYVSSSLHTEKYNHTKGTQITHEMKCQGAEESFHVYAVEWTPDEITTYVDGKVQLKATKAAMGENHDCWPFHYAFYPILNLAWGGDWGGYRGVDEKALPATMKVDYVRIFQRK